MINNHLYNVTLQQADNFYNMLQIQLCTEYTYYASHMKERKLKEASGFK